MHIYSVKELQCLQSTLEMVHAWDSSPQQTDEPCDDADEDLWIFLSVLFRVFTSAALASAGTGHPAAHSGDGARCGQGLDSAGHPARAIQCHCASIS